MKEGLRLGWNVSLAYGGSAGGDVIEIRTQEKASMQVKEDRSGWEPGR